MSAGGGFAGAGAGNETEPLHDVARIGHAELLTPKPDESLRFFVDVLGMEEEAREGRSVYLRGWGDYLRYSLKLTEAPHGGLGHIALRTWRPAALERHVAPEHLKPSWRNQPQRYVGRGASVKRLDHVNVLAADVRASREFCQELLGYRLYERIELDDGIETGAWLRLSIAAHELIYVADHA